MTWLRALLASSPAYWPYTRPAGWQCGMSGMNEHAGKAGKEASTCWDGYVWTGLGARLKPSLRPSLPRRSCTLVCSLRADHSAIKRIPTPSSTPLLNSTRSLSPAGHVPWYAACEGTTLPLSGLAPSVAPAGWEAAGGAAAASRRGMSGETSW